MSPAPGAGDEGEKGPAGAMVLEKCRVLIEEADTLSWKEKFPLVTGGTFIDLCRDIKANALSMEAGAIFVDPHVKNEASCMKMFQNLASG